jgi:hypothetical protein
LMDNISALRAAVLATAICGTGAALADQCNLEGYDVDAPPKVADSTPATGKSEFEWSSDVDPFEGSGRGWHYIRNLHDRDLSLNWSKIDFVISFERGLPKGGVSCKRDYGALGSYGQDTDAAIYVAGEGQKPAIAYVKAQGTSRQAGASIETNYRSPDGGVAYGLVRLIVRYFPADRFLEVDIDASPEGTQVAFDPRTFGKHADALRSELLGNGVKFADYPSLNTFASSDALIAEALSKDVAAEFMLISDAPDGPLRISEVEQVPTGRTPLLLISPEGAIVAATYADFSSLSVPQ